MMWWLLWTLSLTIPSPTTILFSHFSCTVIFIDFFSIKGLIQIHLSSGGLSIFNLTGFKLDAFVDCYHHVDVACVKNKDRDNTWCLYIPLWSEHVIDSLIHHHHLVHPCILLAITMPMIRISTKQCCADFTFDSLLTMSMGGNNFLLAFMVTASVTCIRLTVDAWSLIVFASFVSSLAQMIGVRDWKFIHVNDFTLIYPHDFSFISAAL